MRVTEIIRGILDIIDGVDQQSHESTPTGSYSDRDIKRFKQIVDLADQEVALTYSNEPKEQYADLDAVTVSAGADQWQGTKDPKDIRGTTTRIYGDN